MKQTLSYIAMLAAYVALPLGATRACNMAFNNRDIETSGRHTVSYATGLIGHNEYTRYKDGSSDLKIYPSILGHRLASSILYFDLNGDGHVDRVRVNGPEWMMHRLTECLVRDTDYASHKDQFDEADTLLVKETEKYKRSHGN